MQTEVQLTKYFKDSAQSNEILDTYVNFVVDLMSFFNYIPSARLPSDARFLELWRSASPLQLFNASITTS